MCVCANMYVCVKLSIILRVPTYVCMYVCVVTCSFAGMYICMYCTYGCVTLHTLMYVRKCPRFCVMGRIPPPYGKILLRLISKALKAN